jgi:hypothetical protein
MKTDNTILGCIGLLTAVILMVITSTIVNGWALSLLWAWFVVPIFELPTLSLMQAIGIAMLINFSTSNLAKEKIQVEKGWTDIIGHYLGGAIGYSVITVFFGWIISNLM